MSPSQSLKPARVQKRVDALVDGIEKHVTAAMTFNLAGVAYNQSALLAKLTPVQQANQALADARAVVNQRLQAREQLHASVRPFVESLSLAFAGHFGVENTMLADFGIPYRRPRRQPSAAQKAIAAAQGVQTRRARGSYAGEKATLEGKPGLSMVDAAGKVTGKVTEIVAPAQPGKPRPKKK